MSNAEENRVRGARASHGNNRRNTGSLSLVSRRGERVMRRAGAGERESWRCARFVPYHAADGLLGTFF